MYDVLIIDDDYAIREMLQEALEDAGYRVMGAENGAQALEVLEEGAELPRIILLDLMMPEMTGWEFRREQQLNDRLAAIPVIVLSARSNLHHESSALAVADYLPKPLHIGELLAVVARHSS
jgi:DNA-binding response OmpR family regulator